MTLILAGRIGNSAVLAADRLVSTGPATVPRVTGDADKLFELGACAVATFGCSAPGVYVPQVMSEYRRSHWELPDLAHTLDARRTADGCRDLYGMFLMGRAETGSQAFWIAPISADPRLEPLPEGVLRTEGQIRAEVHIGRPRDLEALLSTMLAYFCQVAGQNEHVGGPYDFLVFEGSNPPQRHQRA